MLGGAYREYIGKAYSFSLPNGGATTHSPLADKRRAVATSNYLYGPDKKPVIVGIGGFKNNAHFKTVSVFDLESEDWIVGHNLPDFPEEVEKATAMNINGSIWVFGAKGPGRSHNVYQ